MNVLECSGRAAPHILMFNSVVSMHVAASPLTKCIVLFSYSMTKVITYACCISLLSALPSLFLTASLGTWAGRDFAHTALMSKLCWRTRRRQKKKRTDSDLRTLRLWTADMKVWSVLWPRCPDLWLADSPGRQGVYFLSAWDRCWSGELVFLRNEFNSTFLHNPGSASRDWLAGVQLTRAPH